MNNNTNHNNQNVLWNFNNQLHRRQRRWGPDPPMFDLQGSVNVSDPPIIPVHSHAYNALFSST